MNVKRYYNDPEQDAARDVGDIQRAIDRRVANPNATPGGESAAHVRVTECLNTRGPLSKCCTCCHCSLVVCKACGACEGSLTTHCPDEHVDYDTQMAVYRTDLDFTTECGWHRRGQKAWDVLFNQSTDPVEGVP